MLDIAHFGEGDAAARMAAFSRSTWSEPIPAGGLQLDFLRGVYFAVAILISLS